MSNLNATKSNSGIFEEQKEGANTGNDISAANIKASKVIDKRIEQNRGGTKDLEYGVNQDADEIEGKENGETYSENENYAKELVNGLDFSENKKENTCKEDAEIALKNKLSDNCSNRPLSDKMGQENARTEPYKDHDEDIGEIREGDERYDKLEQQNLATTAESFTNGIKSSQETRREAQGEYNEVHKSQEMEDEDWVDVLEGGDNMDSKDKDKVKKRKISEHDDIAMEEDKETKAKKKNKEAKEKKEKDKKDKKDKDKDKKKIKDKDKKKIKDKDKEKNKDKKKDGKECDVDRLKQKLEKIDYKMSKLMVKKADYLRKLDHALQKKLVEAEAVVSTKDSLLKGVEELGAKISELNVAAN